MNTTAITLPVADSTVSCVHSAGREMDVNTTWRQIGQHALMYVGARNLAYSKDYVQFDTTGKRLRILVKLDASDTYTVEVGRVRKIGGLPQYRALRSACLVYAEDLATVVRAAFEEA